MILPFPDGCPPGDAESMDGTFYVYAERDLKIDAVPGRMTWQRPYEKRRGEFFGRTDLIEAHALSVFSDIADVRSAREFTPWLRKKSVAEVTITSSDGWLKNSPTSEGKSHHNWWTNPYDLVPASALVIEEAME
ncbi:MAG: hypothetical protein FWD85_01455 [Microbacteriaceae bacterium]|nr:hypothetical protein [Microbacteriaceae bacterium]MCL2793954.1 hypothetical protein [Microbacteriaceae bacterium]